MTAQPISRWQAACVTGSGRKRTNSGAVGLSAKCQKRTHALQHDRRKKKDRQRGGLSEIRLGVLIRRCECSGVLPLPAPAKQTQRAETGGEEREGGGQGCYGWCRR